MPTWFGIPERVGLAGLETWWASSPVKNYFFYYLNEEMNSKGVNNFPKVTDLVRGELGFESGCVGPLEWISQRLWWRENFCCLADREGAFEIMDPSASFNKWGNWKLLRWRDLLESVRALQELRSCSDSWHFVRSLLSPAGGANQ